MTQTAFMYIRVSTLAQQVAEQVRTNREYAKQHGIEIVGQYGDYGKRHQAERRRSFQAMMEDIKTERPNMVLVQRLDRFGTNGPNELGAFLTTLKKLRAKLITTTDGQNRSREDMATVIPNMIASCQSAQEQIDKSERVLAGKRAKALLGEYVGGKYLVYGFDVVCVGRDGTEKWRLVEDAYDLRIKYVLNDQGEYVEAERYGNEVVIDPEGIMPDKGRRHRPSKDSSDRLFYSPSIREERVATLRRICERFDAGWTTYRIAKQLNDEGVRPVYADHWYSTFLDGLLENTVVIGKPAWNRTTQSSFRHLADNRILATDDEHRGRYRPQARQDWLQPTEEVCEGVIDPDLFGRIQARLEARKEATPQRSPRSEELWFAGLWYDSELKLKLSANSQGKHLRIKHPDHLDKRVSFKEAEWFVGEYLKEIGWRLDLIGECTESRKLLERLSDEEFMKELRLEWILLEVQSYLESCLQPGGNTVNGIVVILDHDDEMNAVITTDASYLDLYELMLKDEMEQNQQAVQAMMAERQRLALEVVKHKNMTPFLLKTYNEQIEQLTQQIEAATSAPDFRAWWTEVWAEVELLKEKQEAVKQAIEAGTWVQKAEAIRKLIQRIDCHWESVPTTDKRFKGGEKAICRRVVVTLGADTGRPGQTMTIESSSG
jgi:DNA invertase Pin-like site-specific DNA recombinase